MESIAQFFRSLTLEDWEHIVSIVTALGAALLGIPAARRRLTRGNEVAEAELQLQRRKATIPPLEESIKKADESQKEIEKVLPWDEGVVDPEDKRYKDDNAIKTEVRTFLNAMDNIALGINMGVYDLEVFSLRRGQKTVNTWEKWRKVIEARRHASGQGSALYCEFEKLKNDLYRLYREKGKPFVSRFSEPKAN